MIWIPSHALSEYITGRGEDRTVSATKVTKEQQ
jgi:hypothetical protein